MIRRILLVAAGLALAAGCSKKSDEEKAPATPTAAKPQAAGIETPTELTAPAPATDMGDDDDDELEADDVGDEDVGDEDVGDEDVGDEAEEAAE